MFNNKIGRRISDEAIYRTQHYLDYLKESGQAYSDLSPEFYGRPLDELSESDEDNYEGGFAKTANDLGFEYVVGHGYEGGGITEDIYKTRNLNEVMGLGKSDGAKESMVDKIISYGNGKSKKGGAINLAEQYKLDQSMQQGGEIYKGDIKVEPMMVGKSEQKGAGFWDSFVHGFDSVIDPVAHVVEKVAPIVEETGGAKNKWAKEGLEVNLPIQKEAKEKIEAEINGIKNKDTLVVGEKKKRGRPKKVKGEGIVDDVKKGIERVKSVGKSVVDIAKGTGEIKDLINVLSLGKKRGGKKVKEGGAIAAASPGESFMTPQQTVDKIHEAGAVVGDGVKKIPKKRGGRRLIFPQENIATTLTNL